MLGFITKPIRGIGRLLRGKVKEGLGDIGSGVKGLAPIAAMTGVGAPLAMGLGALGGAAEEWGEGKDFGGIIKGAAGGGAMAGIGALGSKLLSGGQAAAGVAGGGGGGAGAALGAGGTRTIAPAAVKSSITSAPSKLLGAGQGVARWAQNNPELALGVAGAGAQAYGAHQQGKALDAQYALEEENMRRGWSRQDEQDERRKAMDPILAELIQRLLADPMAVN